MSTAASIHSVSLRRLRCAAPSEAVLIACSGFPIPESERAALLRCAISVSTALSVPSKTHSHIFLHISPDKNPKAAQMIAPHARRWRPEFGFGVWPARKPPTMWTKEDFENLEPGQQLRPLVEIAVRIGANADAGEDARSVMFGTGAVIEVQSRDDCSVFLRRASDLLLPTIQEPLFRSYPFYLPLLAAAAVEGASFERLETWLCGATSYIAESIEDRGVLVLSLHSLTPALDQLRAEPDPQTPGVYHIPLD